MKQADIDFVLHAIATKFTQFETLETRGSDSLDFTEVSAAAMKQAPVGSLVEAKAWMRAKVRALVAEAGASPAHVLVTVCT